VFHGSLRRRNTDLRSALQVPVERSGRYSRTTYLRDGVQVVLLRTADLRDGVQVVLRRTTADLRDGVRVVLLSSA
jgi:hypothetical protein